MIRLCALLLALAVSLLGARATAHSIDSATLTLTEISEGTFAIDWQTTAKTLQALREPARYPSPCRRDGALLDCGRGTIAVASIAFGERLGGGMWGIGAWLWAAG